jgi:hypothetical protein
MSKILILEDRPSRQRLFLPNREKDIYSLIQKTRTQFMFFIRGNPTLKVTKKQ